MESAIEDVEFGGTAYTCDVDALEYEAPQRVQHVPAALHMGGRLRSAGGKRLEAIPGANKQHSFAMFIKPIAEVQQFWALMS
jgi:hypothetical protein